MYDDVVRTRHSKASINMCINSIHVSVSIHARVFLNNKLTDDIHSSVEWDFPCQWKQHFDVEKMWRSRTHYVLFLVFPLISYYFHSTYSLVGVLQCVTLWRAMRMECVVYIGTRFIFMHRYYNKITAYKVASRAPLISTSCVIHEVNQVGANRSLLVISGHLVNRSKADWME